MRLQPLEDFKNSAVEFGFDADAVVADGELPTLVGFLRGDRHARTPVASKLHGIADEVLEERLQLRRIGPNDREFADDDLGLRFFDRLRKIPDRQPADGTAFDGDPGLGLVIDAGISQQVAHQSLHSLSTIDHELQPADRPLIELIGVILLHQLAITADRSQRFLQIVRGDVGELLKIDVAPFEVLSVPLQAVLSLLQFGDVEPDRLHSDHMFLSVLHRRADDFHEQLAIPQSESLDPFFRA